jgi:nucleoside-diphosphate-sugar epimerase
MAEKTKKILLLGSSSFAARGLITRLEEDGHEVYTFHRGDTGRKDSRIYGSVMDLGGNTFLNESFDIIINYIVIKDGTVEENGAYIDELLRFCETCGAERLIHISSVSVYAGSVHHVVEDAAVEQDPGKKGAYGALKVIQDLHLGKRKNTRLEVVYVRPGFILGKGLENPIIGMAMRLGGGLVLQLGSGRNRVPVTTRQLVNDAVTRLTATQLDETEMVVVVADKGSPSRREWLEECCTCAGIGKTVIGLPKWLWQCAGLSGELAARVLRREVRPMNVVANMCREMTYDASRSEEFLKLDFSCNWHAELRNALAEVEETV